MSESNMDRWARLSMKKQRQEVEQQLAALQAKHTKVVDALVDCLAAMHAAWMTDGLPEDIQTDICLADANARSALEESERE